MSKLLRILFLFFPFSLFGQVQDTSYFQKFDASGIDIKEYFPQLNTAARHLRDSLPVQYKDNFKVFGYGFYLMTMQTEGGLEYSLEEVKKRAEATGNYYLTISKEPSTDNIYSKFHVDFKLPNSGAFACIDNNLSQTIKTVVQNTIQTRYQLLGNTYDRYADAEEEGMKVFAKIIGQISKGNCKVPNDDDIDKWLISEGFTKLDLKCKVLGQLITLRPSDGSNRSAINVEDFAKLSIQIENKPPINLKDEISAFLSSFITDGTNSKFFIVKNENLYDGKYKQAQDAVKSNMPKYSGIIYIRDKANSNAIDELFIYLNGLKITDIEPFISPEEENYNPPANGATSFQDLVNTVKEAEDKLIASNYVKFSDRLKILRGIYYGTTWSMDYSQMQSDGRNNGFKVYTCNPITPVNPKTILGDALFTKLFKSPEVKDGNKGTDFGHIMIGMEARMNSCTFNIPGNGSSGLETSTWIGDIGGGAGMIALKRAKGENKRAINMFTDGHNFGGWYNIEGDIAAYIIGRDKNKFEKIPKLKYSDNTFISDILKDYLIPDGSNPFL